MMRERCYPMAPLLEWLERVGDNTTSLVCTRLHISDSSLKLYRARCLTWKTADRLAIRAGLHPGFLWPTWFEDALSPLDRVHLEQGWRPAWLWRERLRNGTAKPRLKEWAA